MDDKPRALIAYRIGNNPKISLAAAFANRDWMDGTDRRFANRCLPPFGQAQFTGDRGLAGPWVLDKLGDSTQELGYRPCKDSKAKLRSLQRRL